MVIDALGMQMDYGPALGTGLHIGSWAPSTRIGPAPGEGGSYVRTSHQWARRRKGLVACRADR